MKEINYDDIARDLSDMEEECIVIINEDYEIGLDNFGDNYYEAQAEFDELRNMTNEELAQHDIMAFAYMSGYELCDTGSQENANTDIIEKIFTICDQVGFAVGSANGYYDEEDEEDEENEDDEE